MKKILLAVLFLLVSPVVVMAQTDPISPSNGCITITHDMGVERTKTDGTVRPASSDANTGGDFSKLVNFLKTQKDSKGTAFLASTQTPTVYNSAVYSAVYKLQTWLKSTKKISWAPSGYLGSLTRAQIQTISCGTVATGDPRSAVGPSPASLGSTQGSPSCGSGVLYNITTGRPCSETAGVSGSGGAPSTALTQSSASTVSASPIGVPFVFTVTNTGPVNSCTVKYMGPDKIVRTISGASGEVSTNIRVFKFTASPISVGTYTASSTCATTGGPVNSAPITHTVTIGGTGKLPAPIISQSVKSTTSGETYTITWTSKSTESCSYTYKAPNGEVIDSGVGISHSKNFSSTVAGTYEAIYTCTNPTGSATSNLVHYVVGTQTGGALAAPVITSALSTTAVQGSNTNYTMTWTPVIGVSYYIATDAAGVNAGGYNSGAISSWAIPLAGFTAGAHTANVKACSSATVCSGWSTVNITITGTQTGTQVTLSVGKIGPGSGTIKSAIEDGMRINCGGACVASYSTGASVTLTATPVPGSTFAGWLGDCSGTSTTCTVIMSSTKSVNANFLIEIPVVHITQTTTDTSPGERFQIAWRSTGSNSCVVSYSGPTSGAISATATNGSNMSLTFNSAGLYKITNTCASVNGQTRSEVIDHTVTDGSSNAPYSSLSQTAISSLSTESFSLSWDSSYVDSCTISVNSELGTNVGSFSGTYGSHQIGDFNGVAPGVYTAGLVCVKAGATVPTVWIKHFVGEDLAHPPTCPAEQIYSNDRNVCEVPCITGQTHNSAGVCVAVPTPTAPAFNFTTAQSSVPAGSSVVLNWYQIQRAASCTASGDWTGSKAVNGGNGGSETVTVSAPSKTYILTCTSTTGEATTKTIVVSASTTAGAPVLTFIAAKGYTQTPNQNIPGMATSYYVLNWGVSPANNANTCVASGGWSGTKLPSDFTNVPTPTGADVVYTLTCTGPGGTDTKSVTLVRDCSPTQTYVAGGTCATTGTGTGTGSGAGTGIPVITLAYQTATPVAGGHPNQCSIALGGSSCSITVNWSSDSANPLKLSKTTSLSSTPVVLSTAMAPGSYTFTGITPVSGLHFYLEASFGANSIVNNNNDLVAVCASGTWNINSNTCATGSGTASTYPLTATKAGTGSGTISTSQGTMGGFPCSSTCSQTISAGTSVTLTATPATTGGTVSWSGDCVGVGTTCTVAMSSAKSVTATFTQVSVATPYTLLTVTKLGTGSGTVASTVAGIYCGSACSVSYTTGGIVTLTATPASGSTFTGWSGGGCSGTGTCPVALDGATKSMVATFASSVTGGGTGSSGGTATGSGTLADINTPLAPAQAQSVAWDIFGAYPHPTDHLANYTVSAGRPAGAPARVTGVYYPGDDVVITGTAVTYPDSLSSASHAGLDIIGTGSICTTGTGSTVGSGCTNTRTVKAQQAPGVQVIQLAGTYDSYAHFSKNSSISIRVVPPPAATIGQSVASSASGVPFILHWGSSYAESCVVSFTSPTYSGTVTNPDVVGNVNGPITVTPTIAGTYTATNTCSGPGGSPSIATLVHEVIAGMNISSVTKSGTTAIIYGNNLGGTTKVSFYNTSTGATTELTPSYVSSLLQNEVQVSISTLPYGNYSVSVLTASGTGSNTVSFTR